MLTMDLHECPHLLSADRIANNHVREDEAGGAKIGVGVIRVAGELDKCPGRLAAEVRSRLTGGGQDGHGLSRRS